MAEVFYVSWTLDSGIMALNILSIPLLLASASPRRHFLLAEAGFNVRIVKPEVDEIYPAYLEHAVIPQYLSQLKAEAVEAERSTGELIIAADCIVVLDNEVMGKPATREQAAHMLKKLSGRIHRVFSGFTLKSGTLVKTYGACSEVRFAHLTTEEIDFYLDNYRPYDKAGAYGIQEWLGWCKILSIQGSYSNIMGLPMELVYQHLHDWIPEDSRR